jgi:ubiquinone/menaquinone biosynthesis C-methylase UbiE
MADKERFTTEVKEYWAFEHLHRYVMASSLVQGKTVLDIASGDGYGSEIMSRSAHKVFGVDISDYAIEGAKKKYHRSNLEFLVGNALSIPLPDDFCDVIVCFETLEHVYEHEIVLKEFKRVLKNEGILIISSPNKKYYSDKSGYINKYHKNELYENEFKRLTKKNFTYTTYYTQNTVLGSLISSEHSSLSLDYFHGDFSSQERVSNFKIEPLFLIAICSNTQNNLLTNNSIFQFSEVLNGMDLPQLIYQYYLLNEKYNIVKNSRPFKFLSAIKNIFKK